MPTNQQSKTNRTAILRIEGLIMQNPEPCEEVASTVKLASELENYLEDDDIDHVLLIIDSGGGSASAPKYLTNVIQRATKPVYALIDNMGASAAYKIACSCDAIFATDKMAEIGSIGTMLILRNDSKKQAKEGITSVELYAVQAEHKNLDRRMFFESGDTSLYQEDLNFYNQEFIELVKSNRPNIKETALTGKVFYANDALNEGLIDGIISEFDLLNNLSNMNAQEILQLTRDKIAGITPEQRQNLKSAEELAEKAQSLETQMLEKMELFEKEIGEYKKAVEILTSEKMELETQNAVFITKNVALQTELDKKTLQMANYEKEFPPKHSQAPIITEGVQMTPEQIAIAEKAKSATGFEKFNEIILNS